MGFDSKLDRALTTVCILLAAFTFGFLMTWSNC